jgi:hypothetical protein
LELSSEKIITDFEIAAINGSKRAFPNCFTKCCYFHLTQSIWRQIQKAGLSKMYEESTEFAHKMRHPTDWAYLNPSEIPTVFAVLKEHNVFAKEASKVVDWISEFYVNEKFTKTVNRGSRIVFLRTKPRFHPHMWSVSDCIGSSVPITQNEIESWHHRFNSLLRRRKWNIYKTIQEFQKEQTYVEINVLRIRSQVQISDRAQKKRKR